MSDDINSIYRQLWAKFQDKAYRDEFASSHLAANLAAQIYSLRTERNWTQKQLADAAGMAQARISVMEDPSYEKFNISTLKRLASAFDVVFVGRFIPFSELLEWAVNTTPDRLAVRDFAHDTGPVAPEPTTQGHSWVAKPVVVHESPASERGVVIRLEDRPGTTGTTTARIAPRDGTNLSLGPQSVPETASSGNPPIVVDAA